MFISIVKPTRCTSFSNLFYFRITLYTFRSFRPSSGLQDCTYSIRYMSNRNCYLLASGNEMERQFHVVPASKQSALFVWHIPVAVCTVLNSWWWTERPSKTCRVLFQNKINLRYCASGWFYYRNILRCTVLHTSNGMCI
jgi:hypothetical protein